MASNKTNVRSARMTKNQKVLLVNFVEANKIVLAQKVNPSELQKFKETWQTLANDLNEVPSGAKKSVSEWKDAFNDFKTSVRRKARDLHLEAMGTGGGPKTKKPLSDLEARLLAMLSKIVVTGVPGVEEMGIIEELINKADIVIEECVVDTESTVENNLNLTNTESLPVASTLVADTSQNKRTPSKPKRLTRRSVPQFVNIAKQHEQCLQTLAASNDNLAQASRELVQTLNRQLRRKHRCSAVFKLQF